jgi:hypothetical protein
MEVPADAIDVHVQVEESIIIERFKGFLKDIVEIFRDVYLRSQMIMILLDYSKERGFSKMLGSIHCMHWK